MDIHSAELVIRLGVALTMVLFGISQISNPTSWIDYIPEFMRKSSPMKPETTMRFHALGNIAFGLWLAIGIYPLVGTWVVLIWWVTILPFAFKKDWRIGIRDVSIIASLIALLLLM